MKLAFDEIKRRQAHTPKFGHARPSTTATPTADAYRSSSTYRYTYRPPRSPYRNTSARDRASYSHTYEHTRGAEQPRWSREAHQRIFARVRIMDSVGIGIGIVATATLVLVLSVSSNAVWRFNNRGKSFEDMINNQDRNHPRVMKRPTRPTPRRQRSEDSHGS